MSGTIDFFNLLSNYSTESAAQDPFFVMKGKSNQELLKWLENEVEYRSKAHDPFFSNCYANLKAYKNAYYKSGNKRQTDSNNELPFQRTSKYSVNHLYELTENMVSRMTRVKPAVEVIPANDEFEDQNSAKAVQLLISHLWYINDVDFLLQKIHRQKYIFGESFVSINWDPKKGDLSQEYVSLRDSGKLDKNGNPPKGINVRVGDVCFETILPWDVLLEVKPDYDKVSNVFVREIKHIEEVKRKYKDKAKDIKVNESYKHFNPAGTNLEMLKKQVPVYTFYHKANDEFPNGKRIVFTNGVILEEGDLGHNHGDLPFLRLTDIDIPGQLHGMSRYEQTLNLQNSHNNLSQSIMKNEFMMAAPKWVMPRGACKVEQLGNGRTIIQYQGPVAPQLVQMNPTSQTTFAFRDQIKTEMETVFGVHAISRGEPPKGITAAVALQFLNEQETERAISDIAKHNNFVRDLAIRSISVASDKYDINDGRMLRVLGKENKHLLKFFDAANLHKDYDVRIQNSSAIPQSQSAKMERIIQTMQYAPDLFTPERWTELLEFGSTEKLHTLATEAIHAAESIVQDIVEGNQVPDPEEWEDIITHLRVFYKAIQKRSFKEEVPQERQEYMKLYIETLERIASEKAAKNPLFASKLAQLELFPIFWATNVPASAEQMEAMVNGQANRGEPITGQIPASEPAAIPGQDFKSNQLRATK